MKTITKGPPKKKSCINERNTKINAFFEIATEPKKEAKNVCALT
jgi:hypothetical protein